MENSTVKETTDKVMDKREEAFGRMVKELNGLMNDEIKNTSIYIDYK